MDLRVFSLSNLALALWGTATAALGVTAITGEAHVIHAGSFVPADRIINTAVAPVIKKGATVIDTDDYTVSSGGCLLYTSDAADDLLCVVLGGRRIIKQKNTNEHVRL